jgi:flagellar motor switch protein FliN/FliY
MADENEGGTSVDLEELQPDGAQRPAPASGEDDGERAAADLEAVYDVPVQISAILGHKEVEVAELLKLDEGAVIELDRKVGEAIDIFVNNRLVARGEVVLVENRLGITMTEIIKHDRG